MNNEKLKTIATKILDHTSVPKNDRYEFDPLTILMIISVVLTLIRVLQECNKHKLNKNCAMKDKCSVYAEQVKEFSIKRGWFTKMRIKKILHREMKPEDYEKYSMSIMNSLLNTGETLTDDDLITLLEAANV